MKMGSETVAPQRRWDEVYRRNWSGITTKSLDAGQPLACNSRG
jgi:hypothetical protein